MNYHDYSKYDVLTNGSILDIEALAEDMKSKNNKEDIDILLKQGDKLLFDIIKSKTWINFDPKDYKKGELIIIKEQCIMLLKECLNRPYLRVIK